jgi:hypothetical protein
MKHQEPVQVDQNLVNAWNRTLPELLNSSDSVDVKRDPLDPHALQIFIQVAGRTKYGLQFKCEYVDDREVDVHLISAHKGCGCADEESDVVEKLAEEYIRHIHECAQALQTITHA